MATSKNAIKVSKKHLLGIQDLSILDRWMLNRTAEIIDEVSIAYEKYEFSTSPKNVPKQPNNQLSDAQGSNLGSKSCTF